MSIRRTPRGDGVLIGVLSLLVVLVGEPPLSLFVGGAGTATALFILIRNP